MSARAGQSSSPPVIRMTGAGVRSLRNESLIVLEDVNWEVHPGDFWVLGGLHGSGKTDFLMTLAGLVPPVRGVYSLFGETMPIFDESRMATRLQLGMVFDGGQLFNHLTVADNISLPVRYHRNLDQDEVREELKHLMDMLDLAPFANTIPGALGRNWQRRIGLARALALKPEVLLVDNPLAGLDLPHRNWWIDTMSQLARGHPILSGKPATLVITAADLRPWRNHAKQFAVLRNGKFLPLGGWDGVQSEGAGHLREMLDDPPPGDMGLTGTR